MKLIIFGSTGSIGHHLVQQALEQGYSVTAFTRDASKLDVKNEQVNIVVGNVLDPLSVDDAVTGHDVVLCSLGAGMKGGVRSEGTKNIIHAMQQSGVKRFICQSSLGVGDSRNNLTLFWKYFMFGLLLRKAYQDHVYQEQYVSQSELDWTIIRPGEFTDGDHTGQYKHGFSAADRSLKLKISRADVADFMLKQINDKTYLYKTPGLSY